MGAVSLGWYVVGDVVAVDGLPGLRQCDLSRAPRAAAWVVALHRRRCAGSDRAVIWRVVAGCVARRNVVAVVRALRRVGRGRVDCGTEETPKGGDKKA